MKLFFSCFQLILLRRTQVIDTKISPHLPNLSVDERRIRQVLINLLNNAVKFTPQGGKISLEVSDEQYLNSDIGTSVPQNYLRLAVIDTGIGIAPENFQKVFDPFIQIDSKLNRKYEGTGLGLALVKRIVELHGGKVGLTSEVGVGSCFWIELPCLPDALFSNELPTQSEEQLSPLILLAEDNGTNVNTMADYLEAKGYCLLVAHNGLEAIELALSARPDLIVIDIQIPSMDGISVMEQIRSYPDLVDVPIIVLSALEMTEERERCLAARANECISKPIKLKELVAIIQQLLRLQ